MWQNIDYIISDTKIEFSRTSFSEGMGFNVFRQEQLDGPRNKGTKQPWLTMEGPATGRVNRPFPPQQPSGQWVDRSVGMFNVRPEKMEKTVP